MLPPLKISIGIATFMDRYESCLMSLVQKLTFLFPNTEIIVVANGHVKQPEQQEYLSNIRAFCRLYQNIRLFTHQQPEGLSAIWNETIQNATSDKVLLLNDDVDIKTSFKTFLIKAASEESEIQLINHSWSHFIISRLLLETVGEFDEGLKEIGGEDDDYAARLAMQGVQIQYLKTSSIKSKLKAHQKKLKVNSYGRNMYEEEYGYSSYNSRYLAAKWATSNEPFEGAILVPNRAIKYWKLKNRHQQPPEQLPGQLDFRKGNALIKESESLTYDRVAPPTISEGSLTSSK
jgi:hypothetical protein